MHKGQREEVLVLGATGLLGGSLVPLLARQGHSVACHGLKNESKNRADFSSEQESAALLASLNPTVIVNLIGLTDVDRCEERPNEAYLVNVRTVENVVRWITQQGADCHLVHVSTDQVYDGPSPHTECEVRLTNYYAFSKYAGELAARTVPSSVIRTNFFGRSTRITRASLTDWLFTALSNGTPIRVFDDVFFSPLSMAGVSEIVELCVRRKPIGIFNVGSHHGMSKADFAYAFAQDLGLSTHAATRSSVEQVGLLKAYRPKDMRMDCSMFERALGVRFPALRDEIKRVAEEYRETT